MKLFRAAVKIALEIKDLILGRIIILFSILSMIIILISSLKLRPVADDFCFADSAKSGLFPSMWDWYQTWVGDIAVTFLNTILVGLPGSISEKLAFIPFVVGSIAVAWVGSFIVMPARNLNGRLSLIAILFSSWCAFLWFPALSSTAVFGLGFSNSIAEQSTFWGVVNSSYVIPVCIFIALYLYSHFKVSNTNSYPKLSILFAVIVGLIIGVSGYVLAVSVIVVLTIKLLTVRFFPSFINFRMHFIRYCIFLVSAALGLLISFLAPGVTTRRENFPSPSALDFFSSIPKELFVTFLTIFQFIGNLAFLVAVLSGFLAYRIGNNYRRTVSGAYLIELSVFLFVIIFVNRISELFSYSAISHLQMAVVIQFILGLSIGVRTSQFLSMRYSPTRMEDLSLVVAVLWASIVGAAILYFWHTTSGFLDAWNLGKGYHSVPGYAFGWISECANGLFR
jgi:hypothetical protein